ncbi:hypothetical protein HZA55_09180 [Candidatus Poribacteria bacterium]|nr:hypothetical protein [Candidatus Poribacteria bacterium]
MQAVILAGWKMSVKSDESDSMTDIDGRPFMEYQLDLLKKHGIDDIIVCPGYLGKNIRYYFYKGEPFGVKLKFSEEEDRNYGTGGVIKRLLPYLDNEFYVIYGDSYCPIKYNNIMEYYRKMKMMGIILINRNYNHEIKGNVVIKDKYIESFNPHNWDKELSYVYTNICILNKKIFNCFSGQDFITIEEIFNMLISKKELVGYEISEKNIEISSYKGIERFINYIVMG